MSLKMSCVSTSSNGGAILQGSLEEVGLGQPRREAGGAGKALGDKQFCLVGAEGVLGQWRGVRLKRDMGLQEGHSPWWPGGGKYGRWVFIIIINVLYIQNLKSQIIL